ncbi:hypothetical protein ECZU03_57230 [Escherichia coli]|nr:hypothetical protein ECZU03_57230 [Escherichia coli]
MRRAKRRWCVFPPGQQLVAVPAGKMPVADGERLRVTGKIPGLRVSGGDRLQVASVSEDAMTVVVPGRAEPATLLWLIHRSRH